MAVQAWTEMSLLVGASELAGHGKNATLTLAAEALDTTNYQSSGWTTVIAGKRSGRLGIEFMADTADDGPDETIFDLLGDTDVPKGLVAGSAVGSVAYLSRGVPVQYTPLTGEAGALAMSAVQVASSGVIARGALMHPSGTSRNSSGSGTAVQLGAVASGKTLYAALHVISGSGGTLTVKVQSDNASNFPSAADQITFTGATGRTSEWKSAAGAITDDWWRVTWTITGGTWLFAVTAGIL